MLRVRDLTFTYPPDVSGRSTGDPSPVLKGVDLDLPARVSVGLLGANGSGKSTFLGAITNSLKGQRAGNILIADDAVGPIGYATQQVALYAHLTVKENVEHAARLTTGRWRVRDLVECAIDDYGLQGFVNQLARDISGGQGRIAHLACAFVHHPSVRLLDEPTTALDFQTREKLIDLVNGWRSEGIATLVTAHYPEDIEELCDELVVLVDGKATALGRVDAHLKASGVSATLSQGETHATISVGAATLRELVDCSATHGIDLDDEFDSITVQPPRLRDLLARDPSLRTAVENSEAAR